MTAKDKKRVPFLVLLLVLAAGTWYWVARTNADATATDAAKKQVGKKPAEEQTSTRIETDLLQPVAPGEVGKRNLFQFGVPPAPPPKATVIAPPPPTVSSNPATSVRIPPTTPPPPPFKNFRYEGISISGAGKRVASVSEGGYTYHVGEGEMLMEYRIARITESMIEIEDTLTKQTRTFPRITQ
jgi:hypothetical protein